MTFPTLLFERRFARYKSDFINLPKKELDFINSQYLNSKFLRIWSNVGFSNGRFWHIEQEWESTELLEIEDIHTYMESVYNSHAEIFKAVKNSPEMLMLFQEKFVNL